MKKICAITMARNDEFFLTKWINYYGAQLGKENLYIFLDGTDQIAPPNAVGTTVTHCERIPGQVVQAEKRRLSLLSEAAAKLLKDYDIVIGTDADEYLAIDPAVGKNLKEYLSDKKIGAALSGLGMDVGQHLTEESIIDGSRPFLEQRHYAYVCSRYTKPVVVARPVVWGSGFHRVKGHNFKIDKNLYLFHFGSFDMAMIEARFQDKDRMAAGWGKHIEKRTRTITYVTNRRAWAGERWLPAARILQTLLRPPYALNKPSMGRWKLIVRIPERFKGVV